jgi:UDP-N-acetylmuramate--alanine ligase
MIKVGVFFGGNSREREVSFAGGRTVYDNLDKTLFDAVPIFVDSFNRFIELEWKYIYKGSIRDFYPPVAALRQQKLPIQVYAENLKHAYKDNGLSMAQSIGKVLHPQDLKKRIDIAFLALHGQFGEDGTIQGMLEWLQIPYTGSGIMPSSIGMNKRIQKSWMAAAGLDVPATFSFTKQQWLNGNKKQLHAQATKQFKKQCVIKPANQGSSVGVSVIEATNFKAFEDAVNKSFFISTLTASNWIKLDEQGKLAWIQQTADIKEGIGLPCIVNNTLVYGPDELYDLINRLLTRDKQITLQGYYSESECLIEDFIEGREFSCIVIRNDDGTPVALPPTEIVKGKEVFDYRSKYLPGLSRKITPIHLPKPEIEKIRKMCCSLFSLFNFHVYARIDGFINSDGKVFLNDPNTTSGMMPSSFFFHQAAEIGLNPSQFLTYIIRTSLWERATSQSISKHHTQLLDQLDSAIKNNQAKRQNKIRVAVMMGGYSSERHISVESGRNIYEKLASSAKYEPFPVFVTGDDKQHQLYKIPINIMLKDNADDIKEKTLKPKSSPIIAQIASECKGILQKYGSKHALDKPTPISYQQLAQLCDCVFIALHGRPGEDGTIQHHLDALNLPYNGSGVQSSKITINKHDTNNILKANGFLVADHILVHQHDWQKSTNKIIADAEKIGYPLIAKPADDGCSSAVKKIKSRNELIAYASGVFRKSEKLKEELIQHLGLKPKEEFPRKQYFLLEKFTDRKTAKHFLEITGGMLTHYKGKQIVFETFEPSEALAESEILSLEEKFLAGQGQNITPARYAKNEKERLAISKYVQATLKDGAIALGVEGYCRIDAFVRIYSPHKVEVIFIEVNSLPGMTPATAIFHQCALNGYKPYEFIDKILEFGKQRLAKQRKPTKKTK